MNLWRAVEKRMSFGSLIRDRRRSRQVNRRRRSNPAFGLKWLTMGGRLEDRLLLANQAANLDQWANLPTASWVNGNLGSSKSSYIEGDNIPYRLTFSNLTGVGPDSTATKHTVTIQWDTTKSGKHALDYLTTYNFATSGPPGTTTTPPTGHVLDGTGLTTATAPENDFTIPLDTNINPSPPKTNQNMLTGHSQIGGQKFEMFGGTIDSVSVYTVSGSY